MLFSIACRGTHAWRLRFDKVDPMDKNTLMALAYTLTPNDAKEYAALYPQVTGFSEAVLMGDSLLAHIKNGNLPDEHKLMLAGYLVCYSMGANDPNVDSRVANLLKEVGVSQRYIDRVKYNITRHHPQLIEHNAPPLQLVIRPSQPLQQRLGELVRFSLTERDYRYRHPIPNLHSNEYEHRFDRMGLEVLKKTKGLDLLIRAASKYGFERMLTIDRQNSRHIFLQKTQVNSCQAAEGGTRMTPDTLRSATPMIRTKTAIGHIRALLALPGSQVNLERRGDHYRLRYKEFDADGGRANARDGNCRLTWQ